MNLSLMEFTKGPC